MTEPSAAQAMSPVGRVAEAYRRLAAGQEAAWVSVVPEDEALAVARRLEEEGPAGRPLWGLPFGVKDNIDVAGMVTTVACPAYAYTAERTAPAAQAALDAGAVLVGKHNLDQFATGLVGTRSPYGTPHSVLDPALISGGSSSGSAVAVAEGTVAFSLGTDTAGSGRVPAAANGIVGLKPTVGLVSTDGVVPACRSIDCVSIFARTVGLAAEVLDVLAVPGARPPADGGARWRVGVPPAGTWGLADGQATAYRQAIDELAGWTDVVEVDLAPLLAAGELLYGPALVAERLTTIGPLLASDPDAVHPVVRQVVCRGLEAGAVDVFAAHHRLADLRTAFAPVWDRLDVLACPTVPDIPTIAAVLADPVAANAALGRWTNGVNLLDLCALSVPAGTRPDGLPGSITFLGPAHSDHRLAAIARRRPPLQPLRPARSAQPARAGQPAQPPVSTPVSTQDDAPVSGRIELAVVGAHLRGLPLHHELADRGALFVRACRTAALYRLYALPTAPPKPGMVRVIPGQEHTANTVEAEVWSLDPAAFGDFVARIPAPLGIGTVELDDGSSVKGFLCEPAALEGATDITATGSWRTWVGTGTAG
jgi:allophanate hydrolase